MATMKHFFYIIIAFIICLYFKNSIYYMEIIKPNYKFIFLTAFSLYVGLITLYSASYIEFIYFNF